jgi:ubiquinol-cytochrome c reductase cytochrome b subunit
MSFWGATVITNFFSALDQIVPHLGSAIATWLWGGFAVDNATLNRFFSLHYLMPFVIAGVVVLHIWALHVPGNNNPTGVNVKSAQDTVPFHPYYTVKDGFAISVFLLLYGVFVFYMPDALGDAINYVPANPLQTPPEIVPEWYLLPFYAILRAVPDKLMGVLLMFSSIAVLFVLPWLDTSKVRSMRYRPTARLYLGIFLLACLVLGYCGAHPPDKAIVGEPTGFILFDSDINSITWLSRIGALYYFAYFLLVMPILGLTEKPLPVPESISEPVLSHPAGAPAGATASPEKRG